MLRRKENLIGVMLYICILFVVVQGVLSATCGFQWVRNGTFETDCAICSVNNDVFDCEVWCECHACTRKWSHLHGTACEFGAPRRHRLACRFGGPVIIVG